MNPLLRQAARDRRLTGRDFAVYFTLSEELSTTEYRCMKQVYLARIHGLQQSTIHRALTRLVRAGYLQAKRESRGEVYYRIPSSSHALPKSA